jgi:hypothetical protein
VNLPTWISHEPVVWIGLVDALIIVAVTFGVPITPEQKTAVDGVLAALGLLITRSQVTPNAKVAAAAQNVVVAVPAPPTPTIPPPGGSSGS